MNEVYLCLGGNLGDCLTTFKKACVLLQQHAGSIVQQSSVYQSRAWGMDQAPDFFNQVLKIETALSPEELMALLLETEHVLGRERSSVATGYQNRVLDIDIIFFNSLTVETEMLEIPHPRMHLRKFVLGPLCEIAPGYQHPVLHKSIEELLTLCADTTEIKKLAYGL